MYQKITKSRKELFFLLFVLLLMGLITSCSETDFTYERITIPLITETNSNINTSTTTGVKSYPEIEYFVNDEGYLTAEYDDLNVCLLMPQFNDISLPVYSVIYSSFVEDLTLTDSTYQQLYWNWYSLSLTNYGVSDVETVDINNEFVESYNTYDTYDTSIVSIDAINTIRSAFGYRELSDYIVSYYFELGTVYDNYDAHYIDGNIFEFNSSFEEYTIRESLSGIPIGNINESRRNLFGINYEINGNTYCGSIVGPENNLTLYDDSNVYRFIYYPISDYDIVTEEQPIVSFQNCIDSVTCFLITEKENRRVNNVKVYAAELVYMLFYDSPEYCSSNSSNANYYLVPVWAVYYQMGDVSQRVIRGTLYVNAFNGIVY